MNPLKRLSIVIHEDLYTELLKVASLDNRSMNYTVSTLLQKALKEKFRKRGKKESNITDNTSN
jgi:hypothetical protein